MQTTANARTMNEAAPDRRVSHPLWLRVTHWLNALAVFIMIGSGWQIYNASPLFPFRFPGAIALGGWLGGALRWHFAAMWLLGFNGLLYLAFAIGTGRIRRQFFPLEIGTLWREFRLALRLKLAHQDLHHYNMLQKLAYLVAVIDLVLLVCSGLAIWKPVQFPLLRTLLGDYDNARLVHFLAMSVLVGFTIVHVALVALVPRTLVGMIRGRF